MKQHNTKAYHTPIQLKLPVDMARMIKNSAPVYSLSNVLENTIEDIFYELNQVIFQEQSVDLNHVYLDGTKLKANANNYSWVWKKSCIKNCNKVFEKISALLEPINQMVRNYLYCEKNGMKKYMKFPMYEKESKSETYRDYPYRATNFPLDEDRNMVCPNGKRFFFL